MGGYSNSLDDALTAPGTSSPQPSPSPLAQQVQAAQQTQASPDIPANPGNVPAQDPSQLNDIAQPAPDLPRFQRTFKSTLVGLLQGLETGGIPGAVAGAIAPRQEAQVVKNRQDMATAQVQEQQGRANFATAQAAHELTMANQADKEYQALPQKLQDDATARSLANFNAAKAAGFVPVASVDLTQGVAQNTQNAMTAFNEVKNNFGGTLPAGFLYIHTGNGMQVMRLADPNAALPAINKSLLAQGKQPLTSDYLNAMNPTDRANLAKDAMNFADPRDPNGEISQQSLNLANMRLLTAKQQPAFDGQPQLVATLQATVTHQQAVLDSGAAISSIRSGKAKGAEAQASQPGLNAAKVSEINATAAPEANAAALKSGAEQTAKNAADKTAMQGNTDMFGNQVGVTPEGQSLGTKEYNSRADKFSKDYVSSLNTLQKSVLEFQRIDQNPNQTGAEKVTALLSAVGISGDPLKGKGFRISNDVINEHAASRSVWETGVQKLNTIAGSGGPITSQQISDYRAVAEGVVHDAYLTAAQEARRQGLPVNFLPKATTQGQIPDKLTARIYLDSARGNIDAAHKALLVAGFK